MTGLTPGTEYMFEIAASNAGGSISSQAESTTTYPSATIFTAAAVSISEIDFSWTDVPGCHRLPGRGSPARSGRSSAAWTKAPIAFPLTGLKTGTTYDLNLYAVDAGGSTAGVAQKIVTFPAAPVVTAKASSSTEIKLTWKGVTAPPVS